MSQNTPRKKASMNWGWTESKDAFRSAPRAIKLVFWFSVVLSIVNIGIMIDPYELAKDYEFTVGPFSQFLVLFHANFYFSIVSAGGSKSRWAIGWIVFVQLGLFLAKSLVKVQYSQNTPAPWWPLQVTLLVIVFLGPLFLPSVTSHFKQVDERLKLAKAEKLERYAQLRK